MTPVTTIDERRIAFAEAVERRSAMFGDAHVSGQTCLCIDVGKTTL
jgi:hypothetical protein